MPIFYYQLQKAEQQSRISNQNMENDAIALGITLAILAFVVGIAIFVSADVPGQISYYLDLRKHEETRILKFIFKKSQESHGASLGEIVAETDLSVGRVQHVLEKLTKRKAIQTDVDLTTGITIYRA